MYKYKLRAEDIDLNKRICVAASAPARPQRLQLLVCNNLIFLTLSTGAPVRAAALPPLLARAAARERDWCILVQFYLAEAQQHATRGRACDEVCSNETPGIVALRGRVQFSVSGPVSAGLAAGFRLLVFLMLLLVVRRVTGAGGGGTGGGLGLGGRVRFSDSGLVRAGFATGFRLSKNAEAPAGCGAAVGMARLRAWSRGLLRGSRGAAFFGAEEKQDAVQILFIKILIKIHISIVRFVDLFKKFITILVIAIRIFLIMMVSTTMMMMTMMIVSVLVLRIGAVSKGVVVNVGVL